MSVIVKGMEMPDSCYDCRMRTDGDFCSAMPKEFCGYTDDIKRPDWCPLIELPSHGRLIDAKQFAENIRVAKLYRLTGQKDCANAFINNGGTISTEWWCVEDMINNAPTVIEEEESE